MIGSLRGRRYVGFGNTQLIIFYRIFAFLPFLEAFWRLCLQKRFILQYITDRIVQSLRDKSRHKLAAPRPQV